VFREGLCGENCNEDVRDLEARNQKDKKKTKQSKCRKKTVVLINKEGLVIPKPRIIGSSLKAKVSIKK